MHDYKVGGERQFFQCVFKKEAIVLIVIDKKDVDAFDRSDSNGALIVGGKMIGRDRRRDGVIANIVDAGGEGHGPALRRGDGVDDGLVFGRLRMEG